MSDRCTVRATVVNRLGLHARPATELVDLASGFKSKVTIRKSEQEVDGKSIMQVMLLAATKGTELEVVCEGEDATDCCAAIKQLIDEGFHEE